MEYLNQWSWNLQNGFQTCHSGNDEASLTKLRVTNECNECGLVPFSIHPSILPSIHTLIHVFLWRDCTLIRIREDFCQEIFLKQHLKIRPSDQAKSLNSSPSTLMRSQRFGPFSPMKCWCLDDPCWEVLCAYYRSQTAVLKQKTTFAFPQDTWKAGFTHWTSLPFGVLHWPTGGDSTPLDCM